MQKNRRRKNEEEFFEQVNHMNLNEEMSASWEEREVTEKLSSSVEDIKVPKSLEVESVKSQLKAGKKRNVRKYAEVAAAIALVIAVGGTGVYQMAQRAGNPGRAVPRQTRRSRRRRCVHFSAHRRGHRYPPADRGRC